MSQPSLTDRIRGGLLGTLVGDALGVPVEFMARSRLDADPVASMRGAGTWNQLPGTWSDDGSMTLASADVLTTDGWDLGRMMDGFRRWLDAGWWSARGKVFDIGKATSQSIDAYAINGDWRSSGRTSELSNGNGSLMRCLPVSLWLAGESATDRIRMAGEASALTHAHVRSRLCCAWHAQWCDAVMGGADIRAAAATTSERLRRKVPVAERIHLARIIDGAIFDLPRDQVSSSGYVVSTLEAALWCLANQPSFEQAVLSAVNLGDDADTTGAVTGGMAGWLYGAQAIPAEWLAALPRQTEILDLADRFAERCLSHWSRTSR